MRIRDGISIDFELNQFSVEWTFAVDISKERNDERRYDLGDVSCKTKCKTKNWFFECELESLKLYLDYSMLRSNTKTCRTQCYEVKFWN